MIKLFALPTAESSSESHEQGLRVTTGIEAGLFDQA